MLENASIWFPWFVNPYQNKCLSQNPFPTFDEGKGAISPPVVKVDKDAYWSDYLQVQSFKLYNNKYIIAS